LYERAGGRVPLSVISKQRLAARAYLGSQELKLLHMAQAAASVDNVEGRAMLILSGNYVGFLPPHYAQPWVDSGLLARIDPEHYVTHLDFQIITRKGAESARVVQAFCNQLRAAARKVNRTARSSK
jgi:DNA-binding transcriptional LysR family regulator